MAATFRRYDALSAALVEIQGATGWERFTELPKYLDSDIGTRTMQAFKPGVPVTMEGFAYAGAGFLIGYFLTSGFALPRPAVPAPPPLGRRRRPAPPRTRRNSEWERKEPTGI